MSILGDEVRVQKCGVRFKPPAVLAYYETAGDKSKLRARIMPLHDFNSSSDVTKTVASLKQRHSWYLKSVPHVQLEKLVHLVQFNMQGLDLSSSLAQIGKCGPDEDDDGKKNLKLNRTFDVDSKLSAPKASTTMKSNDHLEIEFDDGDIETGWESDKNDDSSFY